MADSKSPKITGLAWGRLQVEGHDTPYKDAKLWPGGSRAWDWNETGTEHSPGVQPADVRELVEHGAQIVIISQGMNRRLQVMSETMEWLQDQGIQAETLPTNNAVEKYNQLAESEPVGALIHSTC
ncbi:MAG: Mth938-like domain-containing protein [Calditrichota bacterium]